MAYCTLADILEQLDESTLIQCTDDEGSGEVNQGRVARAIADADGLIDGYLGARCAVPLSPVPAIIRSCSVDIAIYNLFSRRLGPTENRAERHKTAIRYLEQVGKGAISLGADDPAGTPQSSEEVRMASDNPGRKFSRDSMKGF